MGYLVYDVQASTCLLGAGLCGLSGMLPDLDSDTGVPLRESIAFGAAVVPMLMIGRLQEMGLSTDLIVLAGAFAYISIRFGLAEILKRYTVHRGMWHSIPAAAIAGLLAYLICTDPYAHGVYTESAYDRPIYSRGKSDPEVRYYRGDYHLSGYDERGDWRPDYDDGRYEEYLYVAAGHLERGWNSRHGEPVDFRSRGLFEKMFKVTAVVLGFMSHLLLDEFYSFEWGRRGLRVKRSFGTAVKFYSKNVWANISTYGKLVLLIAIVGWISISDAHGPTWGDFCNMAHHWFDGWIR